MQKKNRNAHKHKHMWKIIATITKIIDAFYSLPQKSHFWKSILQLYVHNYKIAYV